MRILIINHYIGSSHLGMDYRQYYLAKEWVKQGHQVSILGAGFSHLRIHQPVVSKNLQEEEIEGIRYIWIKTPKYANSGYRRILNMMAFVGKALFYSGKLAKRLLPEVVFVSSTYVLDVYPANRIARKVQGKLVYELHDLWPLSPIIIGGYSKNHPFIRLVQMAENFACRKCDYFVSVLANAQEHLVEHGMRADKFVFTPNGFPDQEADTSATAIPMEHLEVLNRLKDESKVIIGYAGGFSPSNAMESFILSARDLSIHPDLAFVLVGSGPQKDELIQLVKELKINKLYFLPSLMKSAIPGFLNYCDILYAGGVSSVLHRYGTAFNKLTDYMLAGKPIVFSVDEPNSLVEKVGCGIRVPAEEVSKISEAIQTLANLSPNEREVMGQKGNAYAREELGYSILSKKILEAISAE